MSRSLPESLSGFIEEATPSEKTLLLVNRTGPEPLVRLLEKAFDGQSVRVAEAHRSESAEDVVCLLEDEEVVATTPMADLEEAFLLVNADRYRTGVGQTETGSFPAVLTGLDEIEFEVRGFPKSDKEKLLLVLISRFIEARALWRGTGELHSTFQRLSRLDDEYGTRSMYEALADTDVSAHVYGVRDDPSAVDALDVTVHAGEGEEYRRSWVVAFDPLDDAGDAPDAEGGPVALVAIETGPNVWRGTWTYDPGRVAWIRSYLDRNF
ncbi:MAG: histidine kinase [Haloarculaceae archaeon]